MNKKMLMGIVIVAVIIVAAVAIVVVSGGNNKSDRNEPTNVQASDLMPNVPKIYHDHFAIATEVYHVAQPLGTTGSLISGTQSYASQSFVQKGLLYGDTTIVKIYVFDTVEKAQSAYSMRLSALSAISFRTTTIDVRGTPDYSNYFNQGTYFILPDGSLTDFCDLYQERNICVEVSSYNAWVSPSTLTGPGLYYIAQDISTKMNNAPATKATTDTNGTIGKWGGSGTQADPYTINNAASLKMLADNVNNGNSYAGTYFLLTTDINLGVTPYNTGNGWTSIGYEDDYYTCCPFDGIFDGNGHSINGLYANLYSSTSARAEASLFGYVGSSGEIKNLGVVGTNLTGANISGCGGAGGVVGVNFGKVTNCYNTGSVRGSYGVGGVVGENEGTVTNCYNTGSVSGISLIGGVVGGNGGAITNCYNMGTVYGNPYSEVGGVVGVGGSGMIENCYNAGVVSGSGNGGFVGWFATGIITPGTITHCFFLQDTDINMGLYASSGSSPSSAISGVTPETIIMMQTKSTFTNAGWDFNNVWTINSGVNGGYPTLL